MPNVNNMPTPTTALEAAIVDVVKAWCTTSGPPNLWGFFAVRSGYDMMQIVQGIVLNEPYLVNANSKLYTLTFCSSREIYERLKPYIRLTKAAEARLLARYAAEAEGKKA